MEIYCIIGFDSTHHAIKSENIALKNNIKARLIPLPPEISAGCGLCLRIKPEDKPDMKGLLDKLEVEYKGFFRLKRENNIRVVERFED